MPVRDWTPKQRALMDWLSLPGDEDLGKGKGLRQPKTLTALAEKLGVTRETLRLWQQLPGWNEAMLVASEKTFRGLKPEFLKAMATALLKPGSAGYAQVAMALVRYVEPTLEEHEASGLWERILPDTTGTNNQEDTERIASEVLRSLPPANREIILGFMSEVRNREGNEILTERETFQVRRMTTEYQDEIEKEQLLEEGEKAVLEAQALQYGYSITPQRQLVSIANDKPPVDNPRPASLPPTTVFKRSLRRTIRRKK